MGILKWYKRDPRAALVGMHGLTLEQRGAYNTVLDLIYCHDGAVKDDDRFIAGHMSVDVRTWRRIRSDLVSAGKLYVADGKLHNERADREADAAQHRYRSASDAGTMSAMKRGAKRFKFNNIPSTVVPTPVATNHNHIESSSLLRPQIVKNGRQKPTESQHQQPQPEGSLATALPTGALAPPPTASPALTVSKSLEQIVRDKGWVP